MQIKYVWTKKFKVNKCLQEKLYHRIKYDKDKTIFTIEKNQIH